MNDEDLEVLLRKARLEAPSDALDRRLHALWSPKAPASLSPWLWLSIGSLCGAAVFIGLLSTHPVVREGARLQESVAGGPESSDHLVRLALDRSAGRPPPPSLSVSLSTRQLP
jgi:hypothetical protein